MYRKIIYVSDFNGGEYNKTITITEPTEARVVFSNNDGRIASNSPRDIAIVDAISEFSSKRVHYKVVDIEGRADGLLGNANEFDTPSDAKEWAESIGVEDYVYCIVRVVTIETTLLNQNQSK